MASAKLLIIGLHWPEPEATAAGRRMMQLIKQFSQQGYKITFATTANKTPYAADLGSFVTRAQKIALNHDSFDDFVRELAPQIVLFDRFMTEEQFGWRVSMVAPEALRILDTEDLHSLRKVREEALQTGIDFTTHAWLGHGLTKMELAAILRSDLSLIIAEYEMQLLVKTAGVSPSLLHYLPFLEETPARETWMPYEKRNGFVFVGNGKHAPNLDAIQWLHTRIWPTIKAQLPEASINIYGAYLPDKILRMNDISTGFLVHGWAQSAAEVLSSARVCLAPLRYGAGLKGKLVQALRCGTPFVTTKIGAEGIHEFLPATFETEDTAEEFSQLACHLYTNENLWSSLQLAGLEAVSSAFNAAEHSKKLFAVINKLVNSLEGHRTKNIMGGILQLNTLASTKYMSKWIAAKAALREEQNRQ